MFPSVEKREMPGDTYDLEEGQKEFNRLFEEKTGISC